MPLPWCAGGTHGVLAGREEPGGRRGWNLGSRPPRSGDIGSQRGPVVGPQGVVSGRKSNCPRTAAEDPRPQRRFREGFVAFDVPGSVHRNFAWSSDGNRLAVGPQNCEVYLCDVPSQKIVGLKGETSANHCMAWSPDGKLLATGSQNTVRIWNADGKLVRTLEGGHTDIVTAVAWSHDGRVLASGARDRIVRLWDVESGKPLPFEKKVVGPPLPGGCCSRPTISTS